MIDQIIKNTFTSVPLSAKLNYLCCTSLYCLILYLALVISILLSFLTISPKPTLTRSIIVQGTIIWQPSRGIEGRGDIPSCVHLVTPLPIFIQPLLMPQTYLCCRGPVPGLAAPDLPLLQGPCPWTCCPRPTFTAGALSLLLPQTYLCCRGPVPGLAAPDLPLLQGPCPWTCCPRPTFAAGALSLDLLPQTYLCCRRPLLCTLQQSAHYCR